VRGALRAGCRWHARGGRARRGFPCAVSDHRSAGTCTARLPAGRRGTGRNHRHRRATAPRLHSRGRPPAHRGRDDRARNGMTHLERIGDIAARGHADPDDLAFLLDALGAATKAEQRGAAEAVAIVARAGVAVEPLLARALTDADPRRRWGAVFAWSRLGPVPPAGLPVLLAALRAADGAPRRAPAPLAPRPRAPPGPRAPP